MKTVLSTTSPSAIETECLAVVVLDHAEPKSQGNGKPEKPAPKVASPDSAISSAAAELIASGELTGKSCEMVLLHSPRGLKAKRLLLVGGGKAKNLSAYQLRKLAGAAVRFPKPRSLRKLALLAPSGLHPAESAMAAGEGAVVDDFYPDTYR